MAKKTKKEVGKREKLMAELTDKKIPFASFASVDELAKLLKNPPATKVGGEKEFQELKDKLSDILKPITDRLEQLEKNIAEEKTDEEVEELTEKLENLSIDIKKAESELIDLKKKQAEIGVTREEVLEILDERFTTDEKAELEDDEEKE